MRKRFFLPLLAFAIAPALFAAPEKWAPAIAAFARADAAQPPPRDGVLFIGSSSIVKWTTLARDFPGVPVINRGFGGSDLTDSAFYVDRIAIPCHPRVVVVYAGDNDLVHGRTPENVLTDFQTLCGKIHAALPATRIVFIAIKPSPSRWHLRDQIVRANALIAAECARDQHRVFVDVYTPMLDASGQPRPELFVADLLHLNAAGYAIWTPLVAPHLK